MSQFLKNPIVFGASTIASVGILTTALGHCVIARPLMAVRQFIEAATALVCDHVRTYPEAHVRIVADGCSHYFLRVMTTTGAHVLKRRGRPLACRSLSEAKDVARRLRPLSVELEHRVAQDEMDGCAGFSRLQFRPH